MTIHEAIEAAKKGGWNDEECAPPIGSRDRFNREKMVLDPLFFQALGKSLGWREEEGWLNEGEVVPKLPEWKSNWINLILHLSEGGSIESFFEPL